MTEQKTEIKPEKVAKKTEIKPEKPAKKTERKSKKKGKIICPHCGGQRSAIRYQTKLTEFRVCLVPGCRKKFSAPVVTAKSAKKDLNGKTSKK